MKDTTLGLIIIAVIIIIGLATGGRIFTGPTDIDDDDDEVIVENSDDYVYAPLFPENGQTNSGSGYQPSQNQQITYAESLEDIEDQIEVIRELIEEERASPYQGMITMRVSKPGTFDEYITLSARSGNDFSIPITGWTLKSTVTNKSQVIGKGTNLLGFEQPQVIYLNKGDKALVHSNDSRHYSFRINKCSGYLEQERDYLPSLSRQCPRPESYIFPSSPLYVQDRCIEYLQDLPRCFEPDEDDIPSNLSNACENFVEDYVSYDGCIELSKFDSDFYKKEWRVYAQSGRINWRDDREYIELLDNNGKVVDAVSY